MNKESFLINGEALGASKLGMLAVELFLSDNYNFRRNVLNGKLEFAVRSADGQLGDYRVLTQEALNSIVLRAKREEISEGNPKTEIQEYVNSEEVAVFNPIGDYLSSLPAWDGQNHVARLFSRLPGVSSEQLAYLSIWLRSTVAHWLQMDTLHGNEVVPTLIGPQGCGKTTFLRRLLPQHLREYYLDHLNLSEPVEQVRQGDGADEQPAGQPRRARRHPSQPACGIEADAVEIEGQRTPHLWLFAAGPPTLRLVCGDDQQPPSADGRHGFASLHLPDHS